MPLNNILIHNSGLSHYDAGNGNEKAKYFHMRLSAH